MRNVIADSSKTHWVNHAPLRLRPYLQLSRLDRPIGYWLLALPGWIGLAFAHLDDLGRREPIIALSADLKWAILILLGAIAMRGAGCTYNDIVDQKLDAQVARTALRPLPAGTVSNLQAWLWLGLQVLIGGIIWLSLPNPAKITALLALPLVAAYPFMKRITWFPQIWLGLTFNWAVLVACAITNTLSPAVFILYAGLIFWTVGYDTIYALQDVEDDALIGIKSTARRFGDHVRLGVGLSYLLCAGLLITAIAYILPDGRILSAILVALPFCAHLIWQVCRLEPGNATRNLSLFKSNAPAAFLLIIGLTLIQFMI